MEFENLFYMDVLSFICGMLIIVLNSIEIWFLRNTMRRQGNSLVVLLKNLSVADLLIGVAVIVFLIIKVVGDETSASTSKVVAEIREFFHTFCRHYFSTVSLLVLVLFTVIKMLNVTRNRRYTKSRLQRMCTAVWGATLVTLLAEHVASRLPGVYPADRRKYRTLHFPIMTFSAIVIFVYCFTKIFFKLRHNSRRMTRHKSTGLQISPLKSTSTTATTASSVTAKTTFSAEPRFIKIAAFSLIAFVACWFPIATYYVLRLDSGGSGSVLESGRHVIVTDKFYSIAKVLAFCNSILNPIIFFLVYRPVCPRTFSKMYEEHMVRMLEASKLPLVMDGISRWSHRRDPISDRAAQGQQVSEVVEIP